MGQNSALEPRQFLRRITGGLLPEKLYLYGGGAGLTRSVEVEVTPDVKDAVFRSLLSSYGRMSKGGAAAVRRVGVGGRINWAVYIWYPEKLGVGRRGRRRKQQRRTDPHVAHRHCALRDEFDDVDLGS